MNKEFEELLKERLKRISDNLDWGMTEKMQAKEFRCLNFNGERFLIYKEI